MGAWSEIKKIVSAGEVPKLVPIHRTPYGQVPCHICLWLLPKLKILNRILIKTRWKGAHICQRGGRGEKDTKILGSFFWGVSRWVRAQIEKEFLLLITTWLILVTDGVITHLEPDILECEVKGTLESIITNRVSGSDGVPVELFQILKDDTVKVLHSICQQIWKIQQWPQDWKRAVFIPIPKKGNAKVCSNYHTIALISHASKSNAQNSPSQASAICELWTSRCSSWF